MPSAVFQLFLDQSKFVAGMEAATAAQTKFQQKFRTELGETAEMAEKRQEKIANAVKKATAEAEREQQKFVNAAKKALAAVTAYWSDFYGFVKSGSGQAAAQIATIEGRVESMKTSLATAAGQSGPVTRLVDAFDRLTVAGTQSTTTMQFLGGAIGTLASPVLATASAMADLIETFRGGQPAIDRALDSLNDVERAVANSNVSFFSDAATAARSNARLEPRRFRQALVAQEDYGVNTFGPGGLYGPDFAAPQRRGGGGGGGEDVENVFSFDQQRAMDAGRAEYDLRREQFAAEQSARQQEMAGAAALERRFAEEHRRLIADNRRIENEAFRSNLEAQRQHAEEERQIQQARQDAVISTSLAIVNAAGQAAEQFGAGAAAMHLIEATSEGIQLAIAVAKAANPFGGQAHYAEVVAHGTALALALAGAANPASPSGGGGGGGGGAPRGAPASVSAPSGGGSGGGDTIIMNFRGLKTSREIDEIVDGAIKRNGGRGRKIRRGDVEG